MLGSFDLPQQTRAGVPCLDLAADLLERDEAVAHRFVERPHPDGGQLVVAREPGLQVHVRIVQQARAVRLVVLERIPDVWNRNFLVGLEGQVEHRRLVALAARAGQRIAIPAGKLAIDHHHAELRAAAGARRRVGGYHCPTRPVTVDQLAHVCEHLHIGVQVHGRAAVAA
jgi:hypothetical protein